jgi:ABC-type branched-subunit amino acid transport system ATPase component
VTQMSLLLAVRPLLEGLTLLAAATAAWAVFMPQLLDEAWQVPREDRAIWLAVVALAAVVLIVMVVPWVERRAERSVGSAVGGPFAFLVIAAVAVAVGGLSTVFSIAMVELVVGLAIGLAVVPVVWYSLLTILPPRARLHGAAFAGLLGFGVGLFQAFALIGGIDARFGPSFGLAAVGLVLAGAAGVLRRAATHIDDDIDANVDAAVEDQTIEVVRQSRPLTLLVCRHVDFSYGSVQVLFDVNFTIEPGEMVALLGTNGAGKSTLLRVISGLAIPQRGSVRLLGKDVTFLGAERRVADGIAQVPGGRGVFPPLSVVENLRLHGYVLGRERGAVDRGVEAVLEAFPSLAERRNQPAGTLSGGEQQMLALGKALVLRPRLLLIDELSLGLAPKVVGELLDMVRTINAGGTAIVLVEQSVNIALTLVHHAYFMEKGEIRFDGRAQDLLGRTDLLRSVFLGGVAEHEAAGR